MNFVGNFILSLYPTSLYYLLSFLLLPLGIYSQTQSPVSSDSLLLQISVELRGRTAPNECIQIRKISVYADGRVIREYCYQEMAVKTFVKIEKKAKKDDIVKSIQLIEQSDFLKADEQYYLESERVAADIITTIIYHNQNIKKQVVIGNYKSVNLHIPKSLHSVISQAYIIDFLAME